MLQLHFYALLALNHTPLHQSIVSVSPLNYSCSTMKLLAALLLTAVHAKVKPLQLRKTSGIKAVQAVDLGGGKKASGGYGQWAKDNAAANGSA